MRSAGVHLPFRMALDLPDIEESEYEDTYQEFKDKVNMAPKELEDWLETDESKEVGRKENGNGESVGHESGRGIVKIKRTNKEDLTHHQYRHMKKVVNYITRHTSQRPKGDVADTDWCYSLKNWGHDPTK